MVRKTNRVRSRNTRRRRNAPARNTRSVNHMVIGSRVTPPLDPPDFATAPWSTITLVIGYKPPTTSPKSQTYTASDLHTALLEQLEFSDYKKGSDTLPLEYRLLSVRIWGMSGLPISLVIYDSLGNGNKLAELSDIGTSIHYSRLGWRFGSITRSNALKPDAKEPLFSLDSETKCILYIQCMYRTRDAKPSTKTNVSLIRSGPTVHMMDLDAMSIQ